MAPHAMPPTAPATIIAGSSSELSLSAGCKASPVAAMAPIVSCPSAPIFQTLPRNPTASPTAISTSGDALTSSSATPLTLAIGAMKNA